MSIAFGGDTNIPHNRPGLVKIKRAKGRIAGFAKLQCPTDIILCGTPRPRQKFGQRRDGWSFPPAVREVLLQETKGQTVLHPFGGHADFGVRMDIDPLTSPDVVANAYFPPFGRDAFDCVILDPPYTNVGQQEKMALLFAAAFVARKNVYWFHQVWLSTDSRLPLAHAWMVCIGDMCAMRCLQKFEVREPKHTPFNCGDFTRGPGLKYKRWAVRQLNHDLPFNAEVPQ